MESNKETHIPVGGLRLWHLVIRGHLVIVSNTLVLVNVTLVAFPTSM